MNNATKIMCWVVGAALLLALARWPYAYYTALRIVVTLSSAILAYYAISQGPRWAVWMFIAIAIVFNPIFPLHLGRAVWRPIDIICGFAFLTYPAIVARATRSRGPSSTA